MPDGPTLYFPFSVTHDPGLFDSIVGAMLDLSARNRPAGHFRAWLTRRGVTDAADLDELVGTYENLRELRQADRNHIWGYVARNLGHPMWLSSEGEWSDVVVGNPPWLSYRFMSGDMQARFRAECRSRNLWAGGRVATQQDLSGYFFARSAELYLRPGGTVAFVMPYAAFNRDQFKGFRSGRFGEAGTTVRFVEAWGFDERVQPLFNVPSCVLIAEQGEPGPLPATVTFFEGTLPIRDASPTQAAEALTSREGAWPGTEEAPASAYAGSFRDGATVYPRVLFVVELVPVGPLGADPSAPVVQSRRSSQEKAPWKHQEGLRGPVEARFLRRLYLGESIAPYRTLDPVHAVIPYEETRRGLLNAAAASGAGFPRLSSWLEEAERLWAAHGREGVDLLEELDHYRKLSAQFPLAPVRVVYSKSGTVPAAAVLRDPEAVVDHKLYWAALQEDEARYLEAVLNSKVVQRAVAPLQARGQWGPRDFDKLLVELPIPRYTPGEERHRALVSVAERAEGIAASIDVAGVRFVKARQLIRDALGAAGLASEIDDIVEELLGSSTAGARPETAS